MLPIPHKLAFLLFAAITLSLGARAFQRLYRRIHRSRPDPEPRLDHLPQRLTQALLLTLTQQRTFKKRPLVGLFHSFIVYGFVVYLLVNLIDALEAFFPLRITNPAYLLLADILSFLVLLGVLALIARRFLLPSRRDFRFNPRTLLHPAILAGRIPKDSLIVSAFILIHVGSRALASAAKGPTPYEPFATLLAHAIAPQHAESLRILAFWGAQGSILAFLAYFPYTKHIHILLAPLKYTVARRPNSGTIPPLNLEQQDPTNLGAKHLEDLPWPRLLDAYACIQCNRCQDVCPATATGKSLSPAALEINKRMELNYLASSPAFEEGQPSPNPLLQFALSPEATWACTTCGACMAVCPTQDEQMLDIIDIRRHQVMVESDFPAPLQSAFRGMERAQNPWGINRAKRLDWAEGLQVPTTDENPTPDVLYWVGCAASYDPSAQKTARAFVQLLTHANINFAVLGKRECCTGDTARRAGNEYLYHRLANENVSTLNTLAPKLIVASCPHCMNSIGNEYKQIGGNYQVLHHTQYLESLIATGKLTPTPTETAITYHDPCYLGRHNGVYEAPRNLLHILSNAVVELPRNRENAFCCGAGGAQFWKEEEPGDQRIADNRFEEAQQTLATSCGSEKVLAVACPFCKSMLSSTPAKGADENIAIKDIAEILLEAVLSAEGKQPLPQLSTITPSVWAPADQQARSLSAPSSPQPIVDADSLRPPTPPAPIGPAQELSPSIPSTERKKWQPKPSPPAVAASTNAEPQPPIVEPQAPADPQTPLRPKWKPKATSSTDTQSQELVPTTAETITPSRETPTPARKKWEPKKSGNATSSDPE